MKTTNNLSFVLSVSVTLVMFDLGCADGNKPAPSADTDKVEDDESKSDDPAPAADDGSDGDDTAAPEATDPPGATADDGAETTAATDDNAGTGPTVLFGFDSNTEAFTLQDYEPGDPMYANLFFNCSKTDDTRPASCAETTLEWTDVPDPADGADPGMLEIKVPYSGYNQSVELQTNLDPPMDLSNKLIKVRVSADANGFTPDASAPGGGYVFVKSGDYHYARGEWKNFEADTRGTWIEFTMDVSFPAEEGDDGKTHEPTQIKSIGVQFSTGGGSDTAAAPTAAVFHLDHFTVEAIDG